MMKDFVLHTSWTTARRGLRLWTYLARRSIIAQLAYRTDFVLGLARNAGYVALTVVFYQILFLHTTSLAGWSEPAILVLFGTFRLVKGVLYFFVEDNISTIPEAVRTGTLDFVLLKPVSARFLFTFSKINLGALADALVGVGLVVYGLRVLGAGAALGALSGYLVLVVCAVLIFYNLLFMVMTVSFWTIKVEGLQVLFDELLNMAGLPTAVYKGAVGLVFSYVLPIGIAATTPASLLAGRHDLAPTWLYAPVFLVVSSVASQALWRRALRGYTSAGG